MIATVTLLHATLVLAGIGVVAMTYGAFRLIRPGTRPCPRCNDRVRNGVTVCRSCGFDFAERP